MQPNAAPRLGLATQRAVKRIGCQRRAIVMKRCHIVRIVGADQFALAIAIDVRQCHVLVEAACGIARAVAIHHLGPARSHCAGMLIDKPLIVRTRGADGNLLIAVAVDVGHGQAAQFVAAAGGVLGPGGKRQEVGTIDHQLTVSAGRHHLIRAVVVEVGHDDGGPETLTAPLRADGAHCSICAIGHHQCIAAPVDLVLAVLIQVGDGRRGVPARFAIPRRTALPLERHRPWRRGGLRFNAARGLPRPVP